VPPQALGWLQALLKALQRGQTLVASDPAPCAASRLSTTEPSLTLSPTFTLRALTTPACEQGISIEALSDSTGDEALLGLDRVTGLDQQFDNGHFLEVANVGNLDINQCHDGVPS